MFGGDDTLSVVSSSFISEADHESDYVEDEEQDVKFDPTLVKTELVDEDENSHSLSENEDEFIPRRNNRRVTSTKRDEGKLNLDQEEGNSEDDEEACIQARPTRNRRQRITDPLFLPDPCDDLNDEDWTGSSSKRRKRVQTPRTIKRSIRKKNKESRDRQRKRRAAMTSEEKEEQRKKWREEAQKKRAVRKNQTKEEVALGDLVDSKITPRTGRRKKVSEMTPEELEANREKWREEARRKRARYKNVKEESKTTDNDEDSCDVKEEGKKTKGKASGSTSTHHSSGRRKKVSEMTEEERERMKAKWREEARLKRERQKQRMTPEEREEYLRKNREYVRLRRACERGSMTPEELQLKRESAQRDTLRRLERLALMTDEERATRRMRNYLSYRARLAQMTPEELEERKKKKREYYERKKSQGFTEEDKQRMRERIREYRRNMDPAKKEKFLKQLRESYRRRKDRLKAEGKWEDMLKKWRSAPKKKKGTGVPRQRYVSNPDETPEEKKIRLKEQQRIQSFKSRLKLKLKVKGMLESGMTLEEVNRQIETPEQRERRLMRRRVNKAKRKLRTQLASCGASVEEIETQMKVLDATYTPSRDFRPYKAIPKAWKPITPEDLNLLTEETPKQSPSKTESQQGSTPRGGQNLVVTEKDHQTPIVKELDEKVDTLLQPVPPSAPPHPSSQVPSYPYQVSSSVIVSSRSNQYYLTQPSSSSGSSSANQYPPSFIVNQQGTYQPNPVLLPFSQFQPLKHIPESFQHTQSMPSDYGSSSYNSPPPASPPVSSEPCGDNDSYYSNSTAPMESSLLPPSLQLHPQMYSTVNINKQKIPSKRQPKERRGRPRRPHKTGTPYGARHKGVLRDAICDECGNAYTQTYVKEHKRIFHNPHFVDGTCTLCGEKFKQTSTFYKHYRNKHFTPPPNPKKVFMCEECGSAFSQEVNLKNHLYYVHGPGQLAENRFKCKFCPGERIFKQQSTYKKHMKRFHLDNYTDYKCGRCDSNFRNEPSLNTHVKEAHPESYWPCKYCSTVKFSELTINFHYSRGCPRMPEGEHSKVKKEIGRNTLENLSSQCELCPRTVYLRNLSRHYLEMHGLREEKFKCPKCDKMFKRRDFLACHFVDNHNIMPDVFMVDIVKYNVKDRSAVDVKNLEGKNRSMTHTRKKKGRKNDSCGSDVEGGKDEKKRRGRKPKAVKAKKVPKKKEHDKEELDEEDEDSNSDEERLSDIVKEEVLSEAENDEEVEEDMFQARRSRPRRVERKSYREVDEEDDD